jgi:C-terminal processing protease CtpA/Prc
MTEEDSMASRQRFDSVGNSSNTKSVAGNISLFSEDNSFEAMYSQEEKIIVFAPAGKLGVVIDAPSHGVPMVHAIKDTSVLADRVRIGDRLVAVDNSDTTNMSAIQVSKLISSKAMNPTRKMVFIRVESDP